MESLYGQKELAEFCEHIIVALFEVAPSPQSATGPAFGREGIDTPPYTPPIEGNSTPSSSTPASASARKEPPILIEFIAYALYRTRLPISIVHQSLLLLSRLKQRYPSARGTSSSPHRLFLSSLMLSAKISMDDTYSNKSWTIVGSNYFALREVNQMERELFAFLGWNVVVSKEELDEFVAGAESTIHQARQARTAECSKRRKIEEETARHQQAKNAARALLRPHTYRHPSPIRSAPSSGIASPAYQTHHASPDHYRLHRSASSSASSSAFPSATHSPSSPPSAPLSAGPQTPDTEHISMHPHIHDYHVDAPDFADAAGYLSKSRSRESRPSSKDRFTSHIASA